VLVSRSKRKASAEGTKTTSPKGMPKMSCTSLDSSANGVLSHSLFRVV